MNLVPLAINSFLSNQERILILKIFRTEVILILSDFSSLRSRRSLFVSWKPTSLRDYWWAEDYEFSTWVSPNIRILIEPQYYFEIIKIQIWIQVDSICIRTIYMPIVLYFYVQSKLNSNKVLNIIVVDKSKETNNLKTRIQEINMVWRKAYVNRWSMAINFTKQMEIKKECLTLATQIPKISNTKPNRLDNWKQMEKILQNCSPTLKLQIDSQKLATQISHTK